MLARNPGRTKSTYGSQIPVVLFKLAAGQYAPRGQASFEVKNKNRITFAKPIIQGKVFLFLKHICVAINLHMKSKFCSNIYGEILNQILCEIISSKNK